MIKLYNFDELKPEEILNRDIRAEKNVEDVVDAIIADVRTRGDEALKEYALKFDGATIDALQVTQAEIDEETKNELTIELLKENQLDTSVVENTRSTKGCSFSLPEDFQEAECRET